MNGTANYRYEPLHTELFEIRVADGSLTQLTHRNGPNESPDISPDGKLIAYIGFDDRYQGHQTTYLYVTNRDGSNLTRSVPNSIATPPFLAGPETARASSLYIPIRATPSSLTYPSTVRPRFSPSISTLAPIFISEAEQYYAALKLLKVESALVRFPGEPARPQSPPEPSSRQGRLHPQLVRRAPPETLTCFLRNRHFGGADAGIEFDF